MTFTIQVYETVLTSQFSMYILLVMVIVLVIVLILVKIMVLVMVLILVLVRVFVLLLVLVFISVIVLSLVSVVQVNQLFTTHTILNARLQLVESRPGYRVHAAAVRHHLST